MRNAAEKFVKRVSYEQVRVSTIGGAIEIKPSTDGWAVAFVMSKDYPCAAYGNDVEQAGTQLVGRLREIAAAVEADIKAFIERNK